MKKFILMAGLILISATATFAHHRMHRFENREVKIERREARKVLRKERKLARMERRGAEKRLRSDRWKKHRHEFM